MPCCATVEPMNFPIDMSKQSEIMRVNIQNLCLMIQHTIISIPKYYKYWFSKILLKNCGIYSTICLFILQYVIFIGSNAWSCHAVGIFPIFCLLMHMKNIFHCCKNGLQLFDQTIFNYVSFFKFLVIAWWSVWESSHFG